MAFNDAIVIARRRIAEEAERASGFISLEGLTLHILPEELSGLTALRYLDCGGTQVSDLSPLAGLTALQHLDCSRCRLRALSPAIRDKDSLRALVVYNTHVPGLPYGVLSQSESDNCIAKVRA